MALTKNDLEAIEKVSRSVFLNGVEQVLMPIFERFETRFDNIETRLDSMDNRLEGIERILRNTVDRTDHHEERITVLETKA